MMASQLLINEPPLQVLPTLAQTLGLNEAIVLQQVHYWLSPKINNNYFEDKYWVRNTYDQWQIQFPFWGVTTIRRTVTILEDAGLLISFVTRDFKKLKYYTIDYNKLDQVFKMSVGIYEEVVEKQASCPSVQNEQIDLSKLDRCIYKDSENTNSENTHPPLSPPSKILLLQKANEEEEEENKSIFKANPLHPLRPDVVEMLKIWNRTVQLKLYSGKEAHLTNKREILMYTLMNTVLSNEIASWKDYCILIANSRYLSGENARGFKATLDWALIPDNAYKVLEGAIYDKQNPQKETHKIPTWEEFAEELVRTLPTNKFLLPWLKISINLAKNIGQLKYKSWFSKVVLTDLTETTATLSVQGKFIRDYIISNFPSQVQSAIQSLYPSIKEVDYILIKQNVEAF